MKLRGKRIAAALKSRGPNADIMTPEWKAVILADPCVYCGGPGGELEHIRPRANGGRNGWTNIASACKPCNTMKSDGPLWWMLWRMNEERLGFAFMRPIRYRRTRTGRIPIDWMKCYQRMLPRKRRGEDGTGA